VWVSGAGLVSLMQDGMMLLSSVGRRAPESLRARCSGFLSRLDCDVFLSACFSVDGNTAACFLFDPGDGRLFFTDLYVSSVSSDSALLFDGLGDARNP
jgi:hypothetical protein